MISTINLYTCKKAVKHISYKIIGRKSKSQIHTLLKLINPQMTSFLDLWHTLSPSGHVSQFRFSLCDLNQIWCTSCINMQMFSEKWRLSFVPTVYASLFEFDVICFTKNVYWNMDDFQSDRRVIKMSNFDGEYFLMFHPLTVFKINSEPGNYQPYKGWYRFTPCWKIMNSWIQYHLR